nr:unnamed protein product [Callosobruchus chinensis]
MDRKQRHSLQPRSNTVPPPTNLRHTQSQIYDNGRPKKRKHRIPSTISTISENEDVEMDSVSITVEPEKSLKANYSYDNAGYEGGAEKKSISSRAPSMQSLEVVREQYCCCAKRTKCERKLIIAVTVLSIVIIVLIVVIGVIAGQKELEQFPGFRLAL